MIAPTWRTQPSTSGRLKVHSFLKSHGARSYRLRGKEFHQELLRYQLDTSLSAIISSSTIMLVKLPDRLLEHLQGHQPLLLHYDMPDRSRRDTRPEPESRAQDQEEDNVITKDARDIGRGAVDEARQSTKRGIQDGISEDIQKGVGKLLA